MPETARYLERARLLEDPAGHGGRRGPSPWRRRPNPKAWQVDHRHVKPTQRFMVTGEPLYIVERRCTICEQWLDAETAFPTDRRRAGGIDPRCLTCWKSWRKRR